MGKYTAAFNTKRIWRFVVIGIILFVCVFTSVWYGMSSYLYKLIDEGKTEEAVAMIDKMSARHTNSYSAPIWTRPFLNIVENEINLPLVFACGGGNGTRGTEGNLEVVAALLRKGADPNRFLQGGFSPIEAAFARKVEQRYEIAKLLIEYGADVNLYGSHNPAFIKEASLLEFEGRDERVILRNLKLLLDNGADSVGPYGDTALHSAASGNRVEALEELIEDYYPDVDYSTLKGTTPLMLGAKSGSVEATRILLEHGADKTIRDKDGKTAYDYAIENEHLELAELLRP